MADLGYYYEGKTPLRDGIRRENERNDDTYGL